MPKNVTLEDIAKHAGVSKATVSAVINDKPVVKKSTRQKVLHAIEELGYKASGMDIRLQGTKQKSIGLIVKEIDNPFYNEVAFAARSYARERGYSLLVGSSEGNSKEGRDLVALLKEQGCLGVIVGPILDEDSDLSYLFVLQQGGYPMAILEEVRGLQTDLITVDNVEATKLATKYFIDQDHTRILHFAGPRYSTTSMQRAEGFRRAFSESYLRFEHNLVVPAGAHMVDGYEKALEFFPALPPEERPTALICFNDQVAIGAYRALQEMGISVPEEVAICGHDNIDMLDYYPAPISSVDVHTDTMGRRAAEMLIDRIEKGQQTSPQRVYVETDFIVRTTAMSRGVPLQATEIRGDGHKNAL